MTLDTGRKIFVAAVINRLISSWVFGSQRRSRDQILGCNWPLAQGRGTRPLTGTILQQEEAAKNLSILSGVKPGGFLWSAHIVNFIICAVQVKFF